MAEQKEQTKKPEGDLWAHGNNDNTDTADKCGEDGHLKVLFIPGRRGGDLYFTEETKNNPNCIKGLVVNDKTIKLLEENIKEEYLYNLWARGISEIRHKEG